MAADQTRANAAPQGRSLPRFSVVFALVLFLALLGLLSKSVVDGRAQSLLSNPAAVGRDIAKAAQPVIDVDPDHEAVREWLRKNLDDPHFEEVEWSGTIILEERHIREVNRMADEVEKITRSDIQTQRKRQWDIMWEAANDKERKDIAEWVKAGNKKAFLDYVRRKDLKNADGTPLTPYETWETDEGFAARQRFETEKAAKPDRACRLRFRTRNTFGALNLYDYCFVIHEGKAHHDEDVEKYFPKLEQR